MPMKSRKQPIRIRVENQIIQNGENHTYAFQQEGEYYALNQAVYLEYLEDQGEDEVNVRLKLEPGQGLTIHRQYADQDLKTEMPLKVKQTVAFNYDLPGGYFIRVQSYVSQFDFIEEDTFTGQVHCAYVLTDEGNNLIGSYDLTLQYQPKV